MMSLHSQSDIMLTGCVDQHNYLGLHSWRQSFKREDVENIVPVTDPGVSPEGVVAPAQLVEHQAELREGEPEHLEEAEVWFEGELEGED